MLMNDDERVNWYVYQMSVFYFQILVEVGHILHLLILVLHGEIKEPLC